jgi:hypothetical protein
MDETDEINEMEFLLKKRFQSLLAQKNFQTSADNTTRLPDHRNPSPFVLLGPLCRSLSVSPLSSYPQFTLLPPPNPAKSTLMTFPLNKMRLKNPIFLKSYLFI